MDTIHQIPKMNQRRILPYDGYPSKALLESLETTYATAPPGKGADETDVFDADPSTKDEKKSGGRQKKRRSQQRSISDDAPRKISECSDTEKKDDSIFTSPPQSPRSSFKVEFKSKVEGLIKF